MEAELRRYQQQLMEAVDNAERKVRVERLVKSCEEAMNKTMGKHEQLYSFADKTTDPDALKFDLKEWLRDVIVENEESLKKARLYVVGFTETEGTSQYFRETAPKTRSVSQISKSSLPAFLTQIANDTGNFCLRSTDARILNDRTKVCCARLNRSKNLTANDSRRKRVSRTGRRKNEKRASVDVC